jgi:predicted HTH domain antitoxin
MVLDVPNDLIAIPAYSEQEFKIDVAVMLYQRQVLTLARAARWVGVSRLQFQKVLSAREIPINFSIADLETDLRTIQSMNA